MFSLKKDTLEAIYLNMYKYIQDLYKKLAHDLSFKGTVQRKMVHSLYVEKTWFRQKKIFTVTVVNLMLYYDTYNE